jgi:hypothetical protein
MLGSSHSRLFPIISSVFFADLRGYQGQKIRVDIVAVLEGEYDLGWSISMTNTFLLQLHNHLTVHPIAHIGIYLKNWYYYGLGGFFWS